MDNFKDDCYYLERIKSDLRFVIDHTKGKTKSEIEENEVLVDSIMFRIIQIAENNMKLSDGFKAEHREVPWLAIKGMRNRIVHDYDGIRLSIVWETISKDFPELLKKL